MLAFPGMIAKAAEDAGMKVPADPDGDWSADEFPHFHVFCNVQLARPVVHHGEHWGNAKIVAAIPEDQLRTTTLEDLLRRGLSFAN